MNKIKSLTVVLTLLLIVSVIRPIFAQGDLTETFVAEDGSLAFRYPASWEVDSSNESFTQLVSAVDEDNILIVSFISPATLALLVPDAPDAVTTLTKAQEIIGFITGDPVATTSTGREAAIASIETEAQAGFAIVIDLGGGAYGLMLAITLPGGTEAVLPMVNALADSFTLPGEDMVSSVRSNTVRTLDNSGKTWQEAITELQARHIIGPGGSLVFQENQAFFSGQGNFFTPLAQGAPEADVVMAAEMLFNTSGSEALESCILLSRINTDDEGATTAFTEIGLLSDGSVLINDLPETGTHNVTVEKLGLNLDESHYFLYLLQGENLTLYVDGALVVDDFVIADRAGTYGIALRGNGPGARCEGRNIWVYQALPFEPGVCNVSINTTVNERTGPGTQFDLAGQLPQGTVLQAAGQSEPVEGFVWVKLDDGYWVREDVIVMEGDCGSLPVVSE